MAFNVQNDAGTVTDANAYLSVADFRTYWTNKGIDTTALTDATVQGLIVSATQYIDTRFKYAATPLNGRDQDTEFPRLYLYDNYGNLVEGIPREVKNACAEYAYNGNSTSLSNTFSAEDQNVTKEFDKIDVLETERTYTGSKSSVYQWNIYQIADNILLTSGFVIEAWGAERA